MAVAHAQPREVIPVHRGDSAAKELAPGAALRRWFNHLLERWDEFLKRYFRELVDKPDKVRPLQAIAGVLLFDDARDTQHNNAVALREFLLKTSSRRSS